MSPNTRNTASRPSPNPSRQIEGGWGISSGATFAVLRFLLLQHVSDQYISRKYSKI